jgi:hypothetical protein
MTFIKLFWGLLFMFDFRLQGFDILPDIIGYILIFSALGNLIQRNDNFKKAREMSIPLIFLSIFNIYQAPQQAAGVHIGNPIAVVMGLVLTIVHILMVYHICMGIACISKEVMKLDLETLAIRRWKFYFIVQVVYSIILFLALVAPGIVLIAFLPLFIASLIANILLMMLMKAAEREFPAL